MFAEGILVSSLNKQPKKLKKSIRHRRGKATTTVTRIVPTAHCFRIKGANEIRA